MAFNNIPPNGFPQIPDVEDLEAVEKDVKTLKTTATEQGAVITALGTAKAAKADIAPTFSEESSYAVGDLVYYEGVLYECTTEHEAAAWDADDFTATSIDGELSSLKSGLTNVASKVPIMGNFAVACEAGVNIFHRNSMTLVDGYIPTSAFGNCLFNISNHSVEANCPNTIETDGNDNILINAKSAQILRVIWLDISNIPKYSGT